MAKVLIACHQPIRDGLVLKTSFQGSFFLDYVDPVSETTLQTEGWTIPMEIGKILDYYSSEPKEEVRRLTNIAVDKIKELRKETYSSALDTLRKTPGHRNTKMYSNLDWSDIPDNTYDFVHPIHCPIYRGLNEECKFSIKQGRSAKCGNFPINTLLQQSLRVLKPGGSLTFLVPYETYDPFKDPLLKNVPGFTLEFKKIKAGFIDDNFPEFWVSRDAKAIGYVMVNGKLEQKEMFLNPFPEFLRDRIVVKLVKQAPTQDDLEAETIAAMRTGGRKTYRMPRKYSKSYCRKTTCKKMGFTQRSSCRPYKNCFRSGR
jgi:SAM-dependent methyltransferase